METGIPKLENVSYEAVHDWIKSILTVPMEADDIVKYSKNDDLLLGFVRQILKFDRDDFLMLPSGKWVIRSGECVEFGVIQTFKDDEWHNKGEIILLNPYGGKADRYRDKGLVFGPVTGPDDGHFLLKLMEVKKHEQE